MLTAFASSPIQDIPAAERTLEKLDLSLDFSKSALPLQTRQTHPHILFLPMHYEPNYAYPLLIWLHGINSDERELARIMPIISMRNYVAVAPRGLAFSPTQVAEPSCNSKPYSAILDLSVSAILQRPKEQYGWDTSNGLAPFEQRIFDCIAVAKERCNIADHRIFIAGRGTGGTAALCLAMQYPDYFAGAASFGGEIPGAGRILPSWQQTHPISVLLGVDETAPPIDAETAASFTELLFMAGISADIRKYPQPSLISPIMLQDLNRWMMQIICPEAELTPPLE